MIVGVGAFLRVDWLRDGMALWLPEVQASCTIGPRFTTHLCFWHLCFSIKDLNFRLDVPLSGS